MEAALSLGMTTWTALRRIIVPQAVKIVIPPVTNDFIALFKDTSIVSMISVIELTAEYRCPNDQPHAVNVRVRRHDRAAIPSNELSAVARRPPDGNAFQESYSKLSQQTAETWPEFADVPSVSHKKQPRVNLLHPNMSSMIEFAI